MELLKLSREYGFVDEALLKQRQQEYEVMAGNDALAARKARRTAKK